MNQTVKPANERKMTGGFERYLTVWVGLCMVCGIFQGVIIQTPAVV